MSTDTVSCLREPGSDVWAVVYCRDSLSITKDSHQRSADNLVSGGSGREHFSTTAFTQPGYSRAVYYSVKVRTSTSPTCRYITSSDVELSFPNSGLAVTNRRQQIEVPVRRH